jgi:hypothetical protein
MVRTKQTQRPFSASGSPPLFRILSCTSSIMASSSSLEHRVASSVTTSLCVMVSPEKRTSVSVPVPGRAADRVGRRPETAHEERRRSSDVGVGVGAS